MEWIEELGGLGWIEVDWGGNNWGQVGKLTSPGNHLAVGSLCASGRETEVTGNGACPGASCKICTNKVGTGESALNSTH